MSTEGSRHRRCRSICTEYIEIAPWYSVLWTEYSTEIELPSEDNHSGPILLSTILLSFVHTPYSLLDSVLDSTQRDQSSTNPDLHDPRTFARRMTCSDLISICVLLHWRQTKLSLCPIRLPRSHGFCKNTTQSLTLRS